MAWYPDLETALKVCPLLRAANSLGLIQGVPNFSQAVAIEIQASLLDEQIEDVKINSDLYHITNLIEQSVRTDDPFALGQVSYQRGGVEEDVQRAGWECGCCSHTIGTKPHFIRDDEWSVAAAEVQAEMANCVIC